MKPTCASCALALRLFLAIGAFIFVTSCSGATPSGSPSDDDEQSNDAYERALITPDGGTVRGHNGSKLVVPAGALERETWVTLRESPDGSEFGILTPANGAVELEPTGLVFSVPATLTIAADTPIDPGDRFPLMQILPATQELKVMPFVAEVSADGSSYSAQIDHFSSYGGYSPGSLLLSDTAEALFHCMTDGDMNALFDTMAESFRDTCWHLGQTFQDNSGQCPEVSGIEYRLGYASECAPEEDGEINYLDGEYGGEDVVRYSLSRTSGVDYCEIEIDVFLTCGEVSLDVEATPTTVGINEESTVAVTSAKCGNTYMSVPTGSAIRFNVFSGPGEVSPEQTSSWGLPLLAESTFTAQEIGEAWISADVMKYSCQDSEGETVLSGTAMIEVATEGQIVYELSITMTYQQGGGSSTQTETVVGAVPFNIAADTEELSGNGTVTTTGSGVSTFGDAQCLIDITGSAEVTVSGYLDHDTLNVVLDEAWTKTTTITCPDGPPGETTVSPTVQFSFQAPHENGYVVEQPPTDPNLSGHYRWTIDLRSNG